KALAHSYGTLAHSLPDEVTDLSDADLVLNQLPSFLFGGDLAAYLGVPWAVVAVIPIIRTCYRLSTAGRLPARAELAARLQPAHLPPGRTGGLAALPQGSGPASTALGFGAAATLGKRQRALPAADAV